MFIVLIIFLIVSFFEVRYLFVMKEKKEAVLYLFITAFAIALSVYLVRTPKFYSFAHMMSDLFGAQ